MEPRPAPVEINSLLRDIVDVLRPRFAEAGVSPQFDLEGSLPKVQLDANHVEQIFMGLVTNALEATPNGGRVIIRTNTLKDNGSATNVRISIEDTGEGIPVDSRERVFDPFFTTKPDGTGIGCSNSQTSRRFHQECRPRRGAHQAKARLSKSGREEVFANSPPL